MANRKPKDVKFLQEQTASVMKTGEDKGTHKRLKAIWNTLGFTAQQKLDMAIKYTNDTDECGKFAGAVSLWEEVDEAVEAYEEKHADLKKFLKIEQVAATRNMTALNDLRSAYQDAETRVREISETLRNTFGDDLVLRRKRALDLCTSRDAKLRLLMPCPGASQPRDCEN